MKLIRKKRNPVTNQSVEDFEKEPLEIDRAFLMVQRENLQRVLRVKRKYGRLTKEGEKKIKARINEIEELLQIN